MQIQERELLPHTSKDELNTILTDRIGYGTAQRKLSIPLNILLFTEGAQSIAIGLLLPELELQWNISVFQKSLLITSVYFGVSIGSWVQSYSDKYGRSIFITYNAILQTIFGLLSIISTSMPMFIFFRFVYGIGIGIVLPLSATYMSQISPNAKRSKILTNSRAYWSSGCLITCILGWIMLKNHHWRWLLFVICLPGIFALYYHLKNGMESLRYLWVNHRSDEAYEVLKFMALQNQRQIIPKEQVQYLMGEKIVKRQGEFKDLFNQKYKFMTIYLTIAWFTVCFIFYGVLLLLPTILARDGNTSYDFKYIFLTAISIVEVACFVLSAIFMDNPNIGRKKFTYICFFSMAIISMALIIIRQQHSFILMGYFIIVKIFSTSAFMVLYPYTAEIFETLLRGKAMGMMSVAGRIATTLLGVCGVSALYWLDGKGLYVIFFILSFMSGVSISRMPYCTLGRQMDT